MFKNKFTLPIIAIFLMLGSFLYFYIDFSRKDNLYKANVKESTSAKQEAEIAVLFTDLKRVLQLSYLTTVNKEFSWVLSDKTVSIKGWGISGNAKEPMEYKLKDYFNKLGFKPNSSNGLNAVSKGNIVCIVISSTTDTLIDLSCGYLQ